jgi:hypothetical protein
MKLVALVTALRNTRLKRGRPSHLKMIALLWSEYRKAKLDVTKRFEPETMMAEKILREARSRGLLAECIKQGILPEGAIDFTPSDGALFQYGHPTLAEKPPKKSLFIPAGAFESKRSKH